MRQRAMKQDGNDYRKLKWGRNQHLGFCMQTEFYQPLPFFFTRECNPLPLMGNWRGASCFLIGSGTSLTAVDNKKLKNSGIMTIAMNNSASVIRPNMWCCVDEPTHFLASVWLDPTIMKFVPIDHMDKPLWDTRDGKFEPLLKDGSQIVVGDCPNMVYYRRNEKFCADRFLWEDTLNWGDCEKFGGARSVMLPTMRILFLLGFRKVYLIGIDFKMSETQKYAFDQERSKEAINNNNKTYAQLIQRYKELKGHFDKAGFNVFNCSPNSVLDVFPRADFEEIVNREAKAVCGEIGKEDTKDMYESDYEQKQSMLLSRIMQKRNEQNKVPERLEDNVNKGLIQDKDEE